MLKRLKNTGAQYPRQMRLLFVGMLVNATGASIVWPFLTIYMRRQLAVPLTTVALLISVQSAAGLVTTAIGSPIIDRLGRKRAMIFGLLGTSLVLVAMSQATTLSLWYLLTAASGSFNPFFRIGANAMVADIIEPEQRAGAYALLRTAANLGIAIGPAIGGFVVAVVSYSVAFHLAAGIHVVIAIFTTAALAETIPRFASSEKESGIGGYGPILRDRSFLTFCGIFILVVMPGPLMMMLLPVYVIENFGIVESQYGFIMTTNAALVVLLQYNVTRITERYPRLLIVAIGAVLYSIGAGSVAFGRDLPFFILSMVIFTFGEMFIFPTALALVADLAPANMRARYLGIYTFTWRIARGVGPLIGGLLNDNFAPVAIWYGALTIGLVGALGIALLLRSSNTLQPQADALQPQK